MRAKKQSGLEQLLYGNANSGASEGGRSSPSSATLLVSLFLILITFFVILNNNSKPDIAKRKIVLESMQEKFGGPTNELKAFGGAVQPRVEAFTIKLERVLGSNAIVESNIEGDQTKIIFSSELLFYPDETELRNDKIALIKRTGSVLRELEVNKDFRLSILIGLRDYEIDKQKLAAIKKIIGIPNAEIGFSNNIGNRIILVVRNEQ